ncbi:hypothetical protein FJR48_10935 [Sulfurimonas lithotrophica]|uniref:DpnD/PcfM-like C-terminal domain-containing protein n=1 Tax=Sulfurimonas lithotrophica TaxID=2590022 RepID=A0A5P8P3H9_9BACT|nr:DpnD/PcfM family protein [Sulfurimonas lithotrophica]QFR50216.1 hypothetical protein FJR48_10935 [Sulfurimonas lithotrophica]
MKYEINITEVLSKTITVEASSEEEAVNIVSDMYNNEDIVLDYSDFNGDVIIENKKNISDERKN